MSTRHAHAMRFGAQVREGGGVDFRLWAPGAKRVELVLKILVAEGDEARFIEAHGNACQGDEDPAREWYELHVPEATAGSRYRWRIDGELDVPDPASRNNPDGVHDFSEVVDPLSFEWAHSQGWQGVPWHEAVMYEMHVGAFTPEGTYAAAQARLPELAQLGITTVQLMPQASYPGRFGWGYDGVLLFAPQCSHGSPDDLKRFIDAAHGLGLMVMLDVVYNHFGPDGNYLSRYAPGFFSERHHTAWGAAINFDGPGSATVRDFFIDNALYWLEEYRFDGLRFDAVHAMLDDSRLDIMAALSVRVRQAFPQRHIHLVLENDSNDASRLDKPGTPGRFEGQWNGDFHHPVHVLLTGERDGYYAEYADDTLGQLATSLTDGLVWQGGPHNWEHAQPRRRTTSPQPLMNMVNFLQNHDQVGNRAMGDRLGQLVSEPALRLVTAMHLLNPAPPLLFMGEEFGAATPFLYFSDWSGELRQAVTEGRRKEFAQFPQFSDARTQALIPDPCDEGTFQRSKLDWAAASQPQGQRWQSFYRELLAWRRLHVAPHTTTLLTGEHHAERIGERALSVRWALGDGAALRMAVNLSEQAMSWPAAAPTLPASGAVVEGEVSARGLGPWAGVWWIDRTAN
ncbi:malto-oligosyltrehalose trehalohydrolase [Aquabacterium sp. CECT 9606]|uniref:malto-oligosyltrehalose trehalohydrolase n=1 Tax=Aquabacterium sp. CECT 9606 TaxID=2845822 RepID=UPI001E355B22|nr:malto-oligosyltrehalose trehalohydrolase [Aquabacterium sp. CECT 9606]CAH0355676.1 Malto-oligosyltrehalose trehalohydrolase [Aquabacterium sp. CECT 9606]